MGYGFGAFLLVVGLVLALAVTDQVNGVDLTMVGWIMAVVGGLLIVLTAATLSRGEAPAASPPRPTPTGARPSASGVPRSEPVPAAVPVVVPQARAARSPGCWSRQGWKPLVTPSGKPGRCCSIEASADMGTADGIG